VDTYDSDDIPILVIDSYMTKDKESHELWEHLTKLAVFLVENRVAHVIIVSSNTAINKTLNKGTYLLLDRLSLWTRKSNN